MNASAVVVHTDQVRQSWIDQHAGVEDPRRIEGTLRGHQGGGEARRALAVKNYILRTFPNIQAARFQTIGHGSANPVAANATETGRQLNRRTDIRVILASQ